MHFKLLHKDITIAVQGGLLLFISLKEINSSLSRIVTVFACFTVSVSFT